VEHHSLASRWRYFALHKYLFSLSNKEKRTENVSKQ
jgi:hypothetical protein